MALIDLDTAIVTAFTGNGTLTTAFPGGIHDEYAPENTTMPYVVYQYVGAPSQTTYGQKTYSSVNIRFKVIGQGKAAMSAKMTILMTAYDNVILSLAAGVNTETHNTHEPIPSLYERRSGTGDDIYQYYTEMKYTIVF